MIGTTAALIGLAATSAVKAGVSAYASHKASKTQQRAADEVQKKQAEIWGQSKQMHQPYLQAGSNAAGLLGSLMTPGVPWNARPPMQPGPQQPPPMPGGRPVTGPQLGQAMMRPGAGQPPMMPPQFPMPQYPRRPGLGQLM